MPVAYILANATGVFAGGGAVIIILTAIFHIVLAYKTYCSADYILHTNGRLFLMGPFLWSIAVLIFGLLGLSLYWAAHYSKFRGHGPAQEN